MGRLLPLFVGNLTSSVLLALLDPRGSDFDCKRVNNNCNAACCSAGLPADSSDELEEARYPVPPSWCNDTAGFECHAGAVSRDVNVAV